MVFFTSILAQSNKNEFETEQQFCFENHADLTFAYASQNASIHCSAYTQTIKTDVTRQDHGAPLYLSATIYDWLMDGKLQAYSLKEKVPLSKEEIKELYSVNDTIINYDPVTYQPNTFVKKTVHIDYVECYKVKQLWKITGDEISNEVLGITPILKFKTIEKELCWIPIKQKKSTASIINNPANVWVKTNEDVIPFSKSMRENKNVKKLIWSNPIKNKTPIYKPDYNIHLNNTPFEKDFLKDLTTNTLIDTVTTFDPETYAETIEIFVNEPVTYEDLKFLRLNQAWHLNLEDYYIGSKLLGIMPLRIIEDNLYGEKRLINFYLMIVGKLE